MDVLVTPDGDGRYIVSCPSEMEWRAREDLLTAVIRATDGANFSGVIIDLEGVNYISSAGLGGIFMLRKHVLALGGTIVAARASMGITRLLKTVNIEALMPVLPTLAEARQTFSAPAGADGD